MKELKVGMKVVYTNKNKDVMCRADGNTVISRHPKQVAEIIFVHPEKRFVTVFNGKYNEAPWYEDVELCDQNIPVGVFINPFDGSLLA